MQCTAAEGVTMNQLTNVTITVLGAALALACNKSFERQPEMASTTSSVDPSPRMTPASGTRPASEQIARARCDREQECGNIGADKSYSSSQDCLARIQNDWREDLNARECPGGINQHQLDECMAQVRAEACGNPFDTLARITECTQGQICIEEP
jgi:hypothetical protein